MFLLDLKSVNILKQGKPSFFQDNYDMKTRSKLLVSALCNSFLSPENKEKISDFKESGSFLGILGFLFQALECLRTLK